MYDWHTRHSPVEVGPYVFIILILHAGPHNSHCLKQAVDAPLFFDIFRKNC